MPPDRPLASSHTQFRRPETRLSGSNGLEAEHAREHHDFPSEAQKDLLSLRAGCSGFRLEDDLTQEDLLDVELVASSHLVLKFQRCTHEATAECEGQSRCAMMIQ